jgi:hypothetical protein
MARVEGGAPGEGGDARNEIDEYQDMRSIGASEACWRLFEFEMGDRHPAVQVLQVHLPDEQPIRFVEGREHEALQHVNARVTTLTGFFEFNAKHPACLCSQPGHPPVEVTLTWFLLNDRWPLGWGV